MKRNAKEEGLSEYGGIHTDYSALDYGRHSLCHNDRLSLPDKERGGGFDNVKAVRGEAFYGSDNTVL